MLYTLLPQQEEHGETLILVCGQVCACMHKKSACKSKLSQRLALQSIRNSQLTLLLGFPPFPLLHLVFSAVNVTYPSFELDEMWQGETMGETTCSTCGPREGRGSDLIPRRLLVWVDCGLFIKSQWEWCLKYVKPCSVIRSSLLRINKTLTA